MGKSRDKSRKHKGGNPTSVDCATSPELCPTSTGAGGSLMSMAGAGVKQQKTNAENQTNASKHLASGGGKKKKGGAAKVICPQPAAGSGGSISAGGSSAGKNMCDGVGTHQQQSADAVHDGAAKNLSTAPPCDPFSGQCGGKRRRRRKRRRTRKRIKSKRKFKRKFKRKTRRRKTKKRSRKSRRHRY